MLKYFRGLWPYVRQQNRAELTLLIIHNSLFEIKSRYSGCRQNMQTGTVLQTDLITKNIHRLMKMFKKEYLYIGKIVHWKNAHNYSGEPNP